MVDMPTGRCVYDTSFMLVLVSIISSHLIPALTLKLMFVRVFIETLMSREGCERPTAARVRELTFFQLEGRKDVLSKRQAPGTSTPT
jgi:hypothetical protein